MELFDLTEDDGIVYAFINQLPTYVDLRKGTHGFVFTAKQTVELADKLNQLVEERGLRNRAEQESDD